MRLSMDWPGQRIRNYFSREIQKEKKDLNSISAKEVGTY